MEKVEITRCSGGAFATVSGTINGVPVDVERRGERLVLVDPRTAKEIPGAVPAVLADAYARASAESREYHTSNLAATLSSQD
jgi:hypothetical protein